MAQGTQRLESSGGSGSLSAAQTRGIEWEVNIARHCLDSFSKITAAHAVVLSLLVTRNLTGYAQPSGGLQADGRMHTTGKVFAVCNSLSLYSAISGLLVCVYCSYETILSLSSVPMPNTKDDLGMRAINKLRTLLRTVALPSMRRRALILSGFLLVALFFSVAAYISGGLAATEPANRLAYVVGPAIPGCLAAGFLLYASAAKVMMELDFEPRFRLLWQMMECKEPSLSQHDLSLRTLRILHPGVPGFPRFSVGAASTPSTPPPGVGLRVEDGGVPPDPEQGPCPSPRK